MSATNEWLTWHARVSILLADWGIDARTVLAEGHSVEGYYTFVFDQLGNHTIAQDGARLATQHHDWPQGFPYDELLDILSERNNYL